MRNALQWLEEMRGLADIDPRMLAQLGKLDHELFGLSLEISDMIGIITQAIAEAKPEQQTK